MERPLVLHLWTLEDAERGLDGGVILAARSVLQAPKRVWGGRAAEEARSARRVARHAVRRAAGGSGRR